MRIGRSHKQQPISGAWDAIVIGSGLGGLTTAALLARHAGRRVLVLERHYTAGGFTHTFTRPGWEWDVGVHYVGEVHRPRSLLRLLFDHLSEGDLAWADLGDVYDTIVMEDERYPFPRGRGAFRDALVERFPAERQAIDRYLARTRAAIAAAGGFFVDKALPDGLSRLLGPVLRAPAERVAGATVAQVLGELTSDARLRGVLTGQWGDYGLPPGQASFFIHALVAEHYFGGASYPVGGASRIAATMLPSIERAGGVVATNAEAASILVRGGRAAGVRLTDGTELSAPIVVSDAGWALTTGKLLAPEDAAAAGLRPHLPGVAASVAHVSLYVGAEGDPISLGLPRGNLWIYRAHDHDAQIARYTADPDAPLPLSYLSFASARDPDFARRHPGRSTMEVVGFAPYEWFSGWADTRWKKRGEDYEALKRKLSDRMLEALLKEIPSLRGRVAHAELSTPLSTRNFAAHPHGEIYGLSHAPARFGVRELRPKTRMPGLFLTGADVATAGLGGALLGGVACAAAVAQQNLLSMVMSRRPTVAPAPREAAAPVQAKPAAAASG